MKGRLHTGAIAALLALLAVSPLPAADVSEKLRLSVAIGGYNTQDEVRSDSANTLLLLDENDVLLRVFTDPRDDAAVFNDLTIRPGDRATVALQYAFKTYKEATFILEASAGYQKSDVGNVEVQVEFPRIPVPIEEDFNFEIYRIPAGEMTQIPIQLSTMARFRPRANFNPYLGAGLGYVVIGFDPSTEFNDLSRAIDNSTGGQAFIISGPGGQVVDVAGTVIRDLDGARVDARDTFAWHLLGGVELGFKKRWAAFVDMRYVFASREMRVTFDGQESMGISVPQLTDNVGPGGIEVTTLKFGPYVIESGGLIDGGQLMPKLGEDPNTNCSAEIFKCEFVLQPDGQLDPGLYYVQGGRVKYGGISLQLGIRYTF